MFKRLLILLTLIIPSLCFAGRQTIGGGSGPISKTSMGTLVPGDTLAVNAGTYTTANFSNLNGVTIISNTTRVTFTGTVTIGTPSGAGKFSGFDIVGVAGNGIQFSQHGQGWSIDHVYINNCTGDAINANTNINYVGTTASTNLYNMVFDSITVNNSGHVMFGSFGQIFDGSNFIDSVTMTNISINQTRTNGQEGRGVFFRLICRNWNVTYSGTNPSGGDVGLFTMFGNGNFINIRQDGSAGYIARIYNAALVTFPRDSYMVGCLKTNGKRYGMIDIRIDGPNIVPGTTQQNDCYILNNTGWHCRDDGGYIAPIVVLGLYPTNHCYIYNNLGIDNTANSLATQIVQNNSGGSWTTSDSSHNKYFAAAAGVIDTTGVSPTFAPFTSSAVKWTGSNTFQAKLPSVDLNGQAWHNPPSIGAMEFLSGPPPPVPALYRKNTTIIKRV